MLLGKMALHQFVATLSGCQKRPMMLFVLTGALTHMSCYQARARSARARRACALRALGLLLADGAPTAANWSLTDQCFQHEKGVSLESRYEGTKIFTPCPQKIGFWAQKRPNLAKNWHFRPNIGRTQPLGPLCLWHCLAKYRHFWPI